MRTLRWKTLSVLILVIVFIIFARGPLLQLQRYLKDIRISKTATDGSRITPKIVVHLDLKGSPPTMPFLKQFLHLIKSEGADGLLLEYEDMFPYEGVLANLSAPNAYTKNQVLQILDWAHSLDLTVIPLVQTFGHMEFVLKWPEFSNLREIPEKTDSLCPLHSGTKPLLQEMLRQIMDLHLAAAGHPPTFLHLGCDEVYQMGSCPRCKQSGAKRSELYVNHVVRVARMVREYFPGVMPLIWDDMLRHDILTTLKLVDKTNLTQLVNLVAWDYSKNIQNIRPFIWYSYGHVWEARGGVWAAAAYRGATDRAAALPSLHLAAQNVASWRRRQLGAPNEPRPPPVALVLTGWARYNHFQVLCELLPVAVPSLVLALRLARAQQPAPRPFDPDADAAALLRGWRKALRCPPRKGPWPRLRDAARLNQELAACDFLGADAFRAVVACEKDLAHARSLLVAGKSTTAAAGQARLRLSACSAALRRALPHYVVGPTLSEWLQERVEPLDRLLQRTPPPHPDGNAAETLAPVRLEDILPRKRVL